MDETPQNQVDVILHSLPRNYKSEWREWLLKLLPYLSNIEVSLHGVHIHRTQLQYTCRQILRLTNADEEPSGFMCSDLGAVCQNVFFGGGKHGLTSRLSLVKKDFGLLTFTCLNAYSNNRVTNQAKLTRKVLKLDQANGILLMFYFQNVNHAPWANAAVRNGAQ